MLHVPPLYLGAAPASFPLLTVGGVFLPHLLLTFKKIRTVQGCVVFHPGRWTYSFSGLQRALINPLVVHRHVLQLSNRRYGLKARGHVCGSPHCTHHLLIEGTMLSRLLLEKIVNVHFLFFSRKVNLLFKCNLHHLIYCVFKAALINQHYTQKV